MNMDRLCLFTMHVHGPMLMVTSRRLVKDEWIHGRFPVGIYAPQTTVCSVPVQALEKMDVIIQQLCIDAWSFGEDNSNHKLFPYLNRDCLGNFDDCWAVVLAQRHAGKQKTWDHVFFFSIGSKWVCQMESMLHSISLLKCTGAHFKWAANNPFLSSI